MFGSGRRASGSRAKTTQDNYNSARYSLLLIVIFSVANLFLIIFADMYLLFSSYVTQIIAFSGAAVYFETQSIIDLVVFSMMALVSVIPYLLAWIFSKKHFGWMIAALVLFSLDTLLFSIDFVSYLAEGYTDMISDMIFHLAALVTIILGVVYGYKLKREKREEEARLAEAAANEAAATDASEVFTNATGDTLFEQVISSANESNENNENTEVN